MIITDTCLLHGEWNSSGKKDETALWEVRGDFSKP